MFLPTPGASSLSAHHRPLDIQLIRNCVMHVRNNKFPFSSGLICCSLAISTLMIVSSPEVNAQNTLIPLIIEKTTPQDFNIERLFSWSNRDFLATQDKGPLSFKLKTNLGNKIIGHFKLEVTPSIGEPFEVNVNTGMTWCGFKQTYKTTNGFQFEVQPRGWAPDHWRLKRGPRIQKDYIWYRRTHSLSGPIRDDKGNEVAHFHAQVYDTDALAWIHDKTPHLSSYRIHSNGEIPAEYLVALYVTAVIRLDQCTW